MYTHNSIFIPSFFFWPSKVAADYEAYQLWDRRKEVGTGIGNGFPGRKKATNPKKEGEKGGQQSKYLGK